MYYGAIMAVSIVFSDASNKGHVSTDSNATDVNASNTAKGDFAFDYSAIFISSSAEVIGLMIAIFTVDRFGRVATQVWSYLLGGLCILILGLLDFYVGGDVKDDLLDMSHVGDDMTSTEQERRQLIFFAFLARMFMMSATSITWLHTSELMPTEIRATGHGLGMYRNVFFFIFFRWCTFKSWKVSRYLTFCTYLFSFSEANAMGRIGGITSPFIISERTSLRTIGIVMFLVSVATAIFTHSLPETAGKGLGDVTRNVVEVEPKSTSTLGVVHDSRAPLDEKEEPDDVNITSSKHEDDDLLVHVEEKDASSFELL
jgi:hypothetical protein